MKGEAKMPFWQMLEQYKGKTALITEEGKYISYDELLNQADEIGNVINGRCLVFALCRNSAESVIGYLGFLRYHIVPVLLAEQIAPPLFAGLLEAYHPSYIYLPAERVTPELEGHCVWRGEEYVLLQRHVEIDYELHRDLALLLTTSGSTGSPKLVRQSAQNIEANTKSIVEYLGIQGEDRAITTLPMNYTYGLSILQTHLYQGAAVILTEATLMDKRFWSILREQGATTFGGVPYTYEMLKKLRFGRMELPSIRYITQAGGKLSPELAAEFSKVCRQTGIQLIVMYGQTEATARMAYLPWKYAEEKAGSIGVPIPNGRFWLIDDAGQVIDSPETVGELIYSGENVTLGYAQNRFELAKPDENQKVLRTGDMAKRDKDGFYYIVGRKKRFLKLFGNRVNLDELEGILRQNGFDCACTGVDDRMDIYITEEVQPELVTAFLKEKTSVNPNGFMVQTIAKIPRNEAGKILYSLLEDNR